MTLTLCMQGAELRVLRGALETLAGAEVVTFEAPFAGSYNAGAPGILEILAFMDAAGFVPDDITETHRLRDGSLIQVDLVYVRKGSRVQKQVQGLIEELGLFKRDSDRDIERVRAHAKALHLPLIKVPVP